MSGTRSLCLTGALKLVVSGAKWNSNGNDDDNDVDLFADCTGGGPKRH